MTESATPLPADLPRILSTWEEGWRTLNHALLESVWDTSYPHLVYVAEERHEPLLEWSAIQEYYRFTTEIMEWFEASFEPVRADILGKTAWVLSIGRWRGKSRQRDVQSGGVARVYLLARRWGPEWKVIQYIEAPVNLTYASPAPGSPSTAPE
jgi:hypothetical protein